MPEHAFDSAVQLLAAIRNRKLSSRELLEHFLERVERHDPLINAVVTLDTERARKRADAADEALARGEDWGPLHGLPITVKDVFDTEGLRTTAGSPDHAERVPSEDAVGVGRLRRAGAVIFGKTNTPTLALDWQTHNPLFGTTNNPWDPTRSPGGSSGGSAAAVAAGFTGLELGSDIGGSIRNPAHCCGVFGHKPTWGIVPGRGYLPGPAGPLAEVDINAVGPLGRSAEDLMLALEVLAGPPEDRAAAWGLALPAPRRRALREYRLAAWLDDPACPVDTGVRECLERAVDTLRRAGVAVDERARPGVSLEGAQDLYRRLVDPVTAAIAAGDAFDALVEFAKSSGSAAALGGFARHAASSHRDWLRANELRETHRARWASLFREVDALLCPVAPVPAIPHDQQEPQFARRIAVNGAERPYTDLWPWMGAIGGVHLPATVAPVGRTPEGLPVGIQIVGPYLEDRTCLDLARRLEELNGGFEPPPGL